MANKLDILIGRIENIQLRGELEKEYRELKSRKKFGLVFEDHLPEVVPVWKVEPRRGDRVAKKIGPFGDTWRVRNIRDGIATLIRDPNFEDEAVAEVAIDELTVVKRFGDAIYPALFPVKHIANDGDNGSLEPWHTLIQADNYHALQLLQYLYEGKVDCIYIDPPYNTGANDWKYNNDYVDKADGWRHSKWLAFMEKRLTLARDLLKPDTGVLIVTIDEHEVHHLGMLLEELFPQAWRQMVTIVINQKGVAQGRLSRVEEYAMFCFNPEVTLPPQEDDLLSIDREDKERPSKPRWERLLRGGVGGNRKDQPSLFYPIHVDPKTKRIIEIGEPLPLGEIPEISEGDRSIAWPIRTNGSFGRWRVSPTTMRSFLEKGYVKLGGFDEQRKTWTILYLAKQAQSQIEDGTIEIIGRDELSGSVEVRFSESHKHRRALRTVWHRATHDSGNYGTTLLRNIFGEGQVFSYPKSIYATHDAISAVVSHKKDALILDFFAGSGTTLNAVNLMNAVDGGSRRCILVTNNEVSMEDTKALKLQGVQPEDPEWESRGICQSVTWPRSEYTISGRRADGTPLPGEYLTPVITEKEIEKPIFHLSMAEGKDLELVQRKDFCRLIEGVGQNDVSMSPFTFGSSKPVAILFDIDALDGFIAELEERPDTSVVYVLTIQKKSFLRARGLISEVLQPLVRTEQMKIPLAQGFKTNLAYFKLEFLDPGTVSAGQAFTSILPILWMESGCVGPVPSQTSPHAHWLMPRANSLVVLLQDRYIMPFLDQLKARLEEQAKDLRPITHVYLVTDEDESFISWEKQVLSLPWSKNGNKKPKVIQLYRSYLENFRLHVATN